MALSFFHFSQFELMICLWYLQYTFLAYMVLVGAQNPNDAFAEVSSIRSVCYLQKISELMHLLVFACVCVCVSMST